MKTKRLGLKIMILTMLGLLISCQTGQYEIKTPDQFKNQVPWTEKKVNDSPDKFQFAIISDLTGGEREGVFESAIDKINMLQPDFVISIGDLVEGYTTDQKHLAGQWQVFNSKLEKLEAPFFYLPGNHDISNEWMVGEWEKRFGKPYYHFRYKDVLFLVINTENFSSEDVGENQINYFKKVISNNTDVYHTVILMHSPIWDYDDSSDFEKIEKLLDKREYTIFSGHRHNYVKKVKNGNPYYVLATTGGGSDLRGPQFGEFDHIMWVTMAGERPRIANLKLDGIIKDDIVSEKDYQRVQILRSGNWFDVRPVVHDSPYFKNLSTEILFRNTSRNPLQICGQLSGQKGIIFKPENINMVLPPQSKLVEKINISANSKISIAKLEIDPINITLEGSFQVESGDTLQLPARQKLTMDWIHTSQKTDNKIAVDADLGEWQSSDYIECKRPGYFEEGWAWQGQQDGWFKFSTSWDQNNFYIALETFDDKKLFGSEKLKKTQDKIFVNISPNVKGSPQKRIEFQFAPDQENSSVLTFEKPTQVKIDSRLKDDGLIAEVAIPLELIFSDNRPDALRLNIGFMDHDQITNTSTSRLWWRPRWDSSQNYPGSGVFLLKDE